MDSGPVSVTQLRERSALLRAVRAFFYEGGFLEVETPVRIPAPANEAFLEAPPSGEGYWLRTSPELHMKRLLAAGSGAVFQIGPCFRSHERGARHTPEFTLLEWYRPGAPLEAIMGDVEALFLTAAAALGHPLAHRPPFPRFSVDSLYRQHAGWSPLDALTGGTFDPDRFDTDMALCIEPALPQEPLFLVDYPAPAAALARLDPADARIARRFEFYYRGIELANAYDELTDPALQRQRFEEAARTRARHNLPVYPLDEPFLAALSAMPSASGIALGVDRLHMVLTGATDIERVRSFCPPIGE